MIFLDLFLSFLKIGAFTFGGGYAMLPLIRETVLAKGWLDMETLVDFIAVSESTPGPFAVNMATFVGTRVAGVGGGAAATAGVVLPSFAIILLVARFFMRFKNSRAVSGVMSGLRPAVVGLIAAAALSVALTVFFPSGLSVSVFLSPWFYVCLGVFAISLLMVFKKVHPILVIVFSAAVGIVSGLILGA